MHFHAAADVFNMLMMYTMIGEFELGSSNDEETYLTPMRLAIILTVMILFIPNGIQYNGYSYSAGEGYTPYISIFTLTWAYWTPDIWMNNIHGGFHVLELQVMLLAFFYVGFDILYASFIILYIQGKASKKMVLGSAILTLFFPSISLLIAFPLMISMIQYGTPIYIGPILILLVSGLLVVRIKSKREVTPWSDLEKPKGWWTSEDSTMNNRHSDER